MLKSFVQGCLGGLVAVLGVAANPMSVLASQSVSVTIEAHRVSNYGLLINQVVSWLTDKKELSKR